MATRQKPRSSNTSSSRSGGARSTSSSSRSNAAKTNPRSAARGGGGARSTGKSSATRSSAKTNPDARANKGRAPASSRSRGGQTGGSAKPTTDHDEIRRVVESKKGQPACVRGTGGKGDVGLLRIDFPGYTGADKLQPISWDEFFEKFEEQNLAMIYQEKTKAGRPSNFVKLVSRQSDTRQSKSRK